MPVFLETQLHTHTCDCIRRISVQCLYKHDLVRNRLNCMRYHFWHVVKFQSLGQVCPADEAKTNESYIFLKGIFTTFFIISGIIMMTQVSGGCIRFKKWEVFGFKKFQMGSILLCCNCSSYLVLYILDLLLGLSCFDHKTSFQRLFLWSNAKI